jgi:hypothetical protein
MEYCAGDMVSGVDEDLFKNRERSIQLSITRCAQCNESRKTRGFTRQTFRLYLAKHFLPGCKRTENQHGNVVGVAELKRLSRHIRLFATVKLESTWQTLVA